MDFLRPYETTGNLTPFRFFCQKVIPLVYDESLSYYELLCKVVDYLNRTMQEVNTTEENLENLYTSFEELQAYIDSYFEDLNVQTQINRKLDAMAQDGTLGALLSAIMDCKTDYLYNILNGDTVHIGFLGDSITYGTDGNATGDDSTERVALPYPAYIEYILHEQGYENAHCHNYGVAGQDSTHWEEQYNLAKADGCTVISFMFGHNDFRHGFGIDTPIQNLTAFINACVADHITPIVCSINQYYAPDDIRVKNKKVYADAVRRTAEKYGAIYAPVNEKMNELFNTASYKPLTLAPAGIHLINYTPIGAIIIAYAFPFLCAGGEGELICGWRNSGLITSNTQVAPLDASYSSRILRLVSNSFASITFYSDKPFDLYTVSANYVASPRVTWKLINGVDGSRTVDVDYYRANIPASTVQEQVKIFENLPAGLYTLETESISRGQATEATPRYYLCGLRVAKKETRL